jgi:hypothetical protein
MARSAEGRAGWHRRLTWVLPILALLLALPGSTLAAADFDFTILRDVCRANGGDFSRGHQVLKVRVDEYGPSGANKFTLDAKVLHRKVSGGKWTTEYTWDRFKVTFANDANSYFHARWFSYDPKDKALHRIVVVIRVWHNTRLLASKTLTGTTC